MQKNNTYCFFLIFSVFILGLFFLERGEAKHKIISPPQKVKIQTLTQNIALSWKNPPVGNIVGFRIYRSEKRRELGSLLATLKSTELSFSDSNVTPEKKYYYTIRSVEKSGNESRNKKQVSVSLKTTTPESSESPRPQTLQELREPSLTEQFTALEKELLNAKANDKNLAPAHYERIKGDIDKLENRDYPLGEIVRLRKLAQELKSIPQISPSEQRISSPSPSPSPAPLQSQELVRYNNYFDSNIPCTNNPSIRFTNVLVDPNDISVIVPPGSPTHDQITTHTYLETKNGTSIPFYAPVDSTLTDVSFVGGDYHMTFQASCELVYVLGHITNPIDSIKNAAGSKPLTKFSAGTLLGTTSGTQGVHRFDFGVYHSNHTNYYVNDARYRQNRWKAYNADCPYDYFDASVKSAYYGKFGTLGGNLVPGASCRSGSQDIAGTISGNWLDTTNIDWSISSKKVAFGIEIDGSAMRILMTNRSPFFIFSGNPTFKKPQDVTGEHCYSIDNSNSIVYVKIISNTEMQMYVDDTTKTCPASFPDSGFTIYYR